VLIAIQRDPIAAQEPVGIRLREPLTEELEIEVPDAFDGSDSVMGAFLITDHVCQVSGDGSAGRGGDGPGDPLCPPYQDPAK
jgi:hypothetical protein